MTIAIGSDHVGFLLKDKLKEYFEEEGLPFKDFGAYSTERMDYPLIAKAVARAIQVNDCEKGILICGTGVGMAIGANKFKGIRTVVCTEPYTAKASRRHNDTNILALGARVIGIELAKMIVGIWLNTSYDSGRHQKRLDMVSNFEI